MLNVESCDNKSKWRSIHFIKSIYALRGIGQLVRDVVSNVVNGGLRESLQKAKTESLAQSEQPPTRLPPLTGSQQKSIKRPLNGHSWAEGTCGDWGGNVTAATVAVCVCWWAGPRRVTWNVRPRSESLACGLCARPCTPDMWQSEPVRVWYGFVYLVEHGRDKELFLSHNKQYALEKLGFRQGRQCGAVLWQTDHESGSMCSAPCLVFAHRYPLHAGSTQLLNREEKLFENCYF